MRIIFENETYDKNCKCFDTEDFQDSDVESLFYYLDKPEINFKNDELFEIELIFKNKLKCLIRLVEIINPKIKYSNNEKKNERIKNI